TDHTNYFFDVQPEFFPEALDRFAQFFIAPLLDKAYVEREKNAVHSEYKMQIKDDGWRGFMVQKVAINPEHPLSKINIGTLDSLDGDVYDALVDFF
ncbi:MAG: insulinase family protein, partial [Pseudomonadales bacterium]